MKVISHSRQGSFGAFNLGVWVLTAPPTGKVFACIRPNFRVNED